jgi:stearoyl-CoA desaturase (delta-9 desaturase)
MYLACALVFLTTYLLNVTYVTVFYHRGFAHGAVTMSRRVRHFIAATGNWVTGLDPKAWACMHRQHHQFADAAEDPHSPANLGVPGVMLGQLRAYERNLSLLINGHPTTAAVVADLDFPVSWVNRRTWTLPYLMHFAIAAALVVAFQSWLLGAAWFFGLMSHPVQGWMVNALGHAYGYRNFDTPDRSRNNPLVAWFVVGEGYQNNHHFAPRNARMSVKWFEFDSGYLLCRALELLGVISIVRPDGDHKPVTA